MRRSAPSTSTTPRSPTLTNCAPHAAAPRAASAAVWGSAGRSPSATLTGAAPPTAATTSDRTRGDGAPSAPSRGSLTSMMSAPPASARRASSAETTLTSNLMRPPPPRLGDRSRPRGRPCRRRPLPRRPSATSKARSSLSTIPYTVGPHELCPTAPTPSPCSASTTGAACGWNTPPCCEENIDPISRWISVSAAPNSSMSSVTSPGSSAVKTKRDTRGSMAVPSACSKLKNLSSAFPDRPSTPRGRASTHRQRSGIGCRATSGLSQPPRQHAGLDHEARRGEGPGAHARALSAPGGVRELDRPGRDPRELGHSARDREAELRARTQSGVRRNRLAYIDLNAGSVAEGLACPFGERGSAIGLRSVCDDAPRRAGR